MINHPAVASSRITCNAAPEQHEGRLTDGRWFYFRFRFGNASLGIADSEWGAVEASFGHDMRVGVDGLAGQFESPEQRDRVFAELFEVAS